MFLAPYRFPWIHLCMQFFMDDCLQNLLDYTETHEGELTEMVLQERITKLVECRLEMQIPFISRWAQALSIQVCINVWG